MWLTKASVSEAQFFERVWRQKPLALGHYTQLVEMGFVVTPQVLFELSSSDLIESRLIKADFTVAHGPIELDELEGGTMLMVQSLESLLEPVSNLLTQLFGFLPRWRIEDVMATYAHTGANCGAHFDYYDVFLLQIRGEKHWQLDVGNHQPGDLKREADIRLLEKFQPTVHLTQKPGDMLYIPPATGHLGIAGDDSLTLSVGIRNPTDKEMISHLADLVMQQEDSGCTLDDQISGSVLNAAKISQLQDRVLDELKRKNLAGTWFGSYMTQLGNPDLIDWPETQPSIVMLSSLLAQHTRVECNLPTRLAYMTEGQQVQVFVNGESASFDSRDLNVLWLLTLQQSRRVDTDTLEDNLTNLQILQFLYLEGAISFAGEQDE